MEEMAQELRGSSFEVVRSREIQFFDPSVTVVMVEHLIQDWDGGLRDRFPMTLKYEPSGFEGDWVTADGMRVLSPVNLVAAKFHALFKVRNTSVISSRSRDLIDLFSLHMGDHRSELRAGAAFARSRLLSQGVTATGPPREWQLPWQGYCLGSGVSTSLLEAWRAVKAYIDELSGT